MKTPILAAMALAAASALSAAAQIQNIQLSVTTQGVGYVTGTVQVKSPSGTTVALAMAIDDAGLTVPGPNAYWFISDGGSVGNPPDHACPTVGDITGNYEPGASVWYTVNVDAAYPQNMLPACQSRKMFILVAQYGGGEMGIQGCGSFDVIAYAPWDNYPFQAGSGSCPTATATPVPSATHTAIATATPGGATPVPTPTPWLDATATPGTPSPTPANTPAATPRASGGTVSGAAPEPNPGARRVAFLVAGRVDSVRAQVFTAAYTLAGESLADHPAPGWDRLDLPRLGPGTYFIRVSAFSGGAETSRSFATAIVRP